MVEFMEDEIEDKTGENGSKVPCRQGGRADILLIPTTPASSCRGLKTLWPFPIIPSKPPV